MSTVAGRRARFARAAVLTIMAAAALAGIHRASASGAPEASRAVKAPPPVLTEDASPPATPARARPAVPARAEPPDGTTCAPSWRWFENPAMHYGLCVPPGWGFTDFTTPAAMDRIPAEQLFGLRLVGSRAFPWSPGTRPFDAVRRAGVVDVELNLLEPGLEASSECEPSTPRPVAGHVLLTCEQRYDAFGLPARVGAVHAIKVVVPLLREPESLHAAADLSGARLLVVARTSDATPRREVETLWDVIDGIRPL